MKGYPPERALIRLASSVGVDSIPLKKCINDNGSRISSDAIGLVKTASRGGINYTPTWILDDSVFVTEEVLVRLRRMHGEFSNSPATSAIHGAEAWEQPQVWVAQRSRL